LLTEIEAPPFKEQRRAEAFLVRMKALGLADARIDAEGNVIGVRRGSGNGPRLLVSAHLDTVFPAGTDVRVKERDGRLHAPGISDDTRALSVLLSWLKVLNDQQVKTVGDLIFVGNVGEEELGNLRGMKAIFRDHLDIDGMVGLEPAADGTVLVLGTASHRYEVTFKGPGGHSYGAFGQVPSAVHGMGRAIARIADIETPASPRTTFTVGTVSGGTSVNTIAPDARMTVDIRSDETGPLLDTEKKVLAAIDEAVAAENKRWNVNTLSASTKLIGDRPGGRTPVDSVIVEAVVRSNAAFGHRTLLVGASTDANVAMSLGIPAITIGTGGRTGGFHALSEWIDVTDAWQGAQNALVTVLGLVGVQGVSEPLLARRPPRAR
jgi:acetylornithine deacetylase/succinyl-diaminopimelate desuccinylase-like protein